MNFHNIEAVLFDLDNTLLDRTKTFAKYCDHFLDVLFSEKITNSEKDNIKKYMIENDKNGYEQRSVFYQNLIEKWDLPCNAQDLENEWREHFYKYSVPEDCLIEVMEYLSGKYKLGIVTNGSSHMQNSKIDALGIRRFFQTIVISAEVGIKKPDSEIFLLACEKLNIPASSALFIGDNFQFDVVGAANAGLSSIWLNKASVKDDYPVTIKYLSELINLL